MADVLETTQQIVLSVRIRGDEKGPQTGDVVLDANVFSNFKDTEAYSKNEAVIYQGAIYRAKEDTDAGEWNPDQWECLTDITMRIGDFQPNHQYKQSEVIQVNGTLYKAIQDFTTGEEFDPTEWQAIDSVNTILNSFEENSDYSINEIVEHEGKLYRAKRQFISDNWNPADWQLINDLLVDDFKTNTTYTKGNIIVSSGKLFRANRDFTSGTIWEPEFWDPINSTGVGGFNSNTYYPVGSMIYVDGKIYVAKEDFTSVTEFDPEDWEVASETKAENYDNNHNYQKDEIVYYQGAIYRAKEDFVSGSVFDTSDWEILGSSTTDGFKPNTKYLKGTIIFHEGILWIAKRTFTSEATFNPSDWDPLTQTEQETYDSWMSTGTTVTVEDLDEKFVNESNNDIYSWHSVDSATSYHEVSNTNAKARLQATSGEARLSLTDNDSSTILTDELFNISKGDSYFKVDMDEKTISMSQDLSDSFGENIVTMSESQKGVAKSDGSSTRVLNDVLTAYPLPNVYASGHLYKQYELCSYKNKVYSAKAEFTAGAWDISQWYPVQQTISTYAVDDTYSVGDVIQVNNRLYFCKNAISAAPASMVSADWQVIKIAGADVIVDPGTNTIATSSNLNTAISQLDGKLNTAVQPRDNITKFLLTTQTAGSTAPAAVAGKTTICLFTE